MNNYLLHEFFYMESMSRLEYSWPFRLIEQVENAKKDKDYVYEYGGNAFQVKITHNEVLIELVVMEPVEQLVVSLDIFEESIAFYKKVIFDEEGVNKNLKKYIPTMTHGAMAKAAGLITQEAINEAKEKLASLAKYRNL